MKKLILILAFLVILPFVSSQLNCPSGEIDCGLECAGAHQFCCPAGNVCNEPYNVQGGIDYVGDNCIGFDSGPNAVPGCCTIGLTEICGNLCCNLGDTCVDPFRTSEGIPDPLCCDLSTQHVCEYDCGPKTCVPIGQDCARTPGVEDYCPTGSPNVALRPDREYDLCCPEGQTGDVDSVGDGANGLCCPSGEDHCGINCCSEPGKPYCALPSTQTPGFAQICCATPGDIACVYQQNPVRPDDRFPPIDICCDDSRCSDGSGTCTQIPESGCTDCTVGADPDTGCTLEEYNNNIDDYTCGFNIDCAPHSDTVDPTNSACCPEDSPRYCAGSLGTTCCGPGEMCNDGVCTGQVQISCESICQGEGFLGGYDYEDHATLFGGGIYNINRDISYREVEQDSNLPNTFFCARRIHNESCLPESPDFLGQKGCNGAMVEYDLMQSFCSDTSRIDHDCCCVQEEPFYGFGFDINDNCEDCQTQPEGWYINGTNTLILAEACTIGSSCHNNKDDDGDGFVDDEDPSCQDTPMFSPGGPRAGGCEVGGCTVPVDTDCGEWCPTDECLEDGIQDTEDNNDFLQAQRIPSFDCRDISGELSTEDDLDIYYIGGIERGQRIILDVATPGELDSVMAIFDEDQDLIDVNDDRSYYGGFLDPSISQIMQRDIERLYIGLGPSSSSIAFYNGEPTGEYTIELPIAPELEEITTPNPQKLLLDFDGAENIQIGLEPTINISVFDAADINETFAGQTDFMIGIIINRMEEDFAPYNIIIYSTTGILPTGDFTTIHFGEFNMQYLGLADNTDIFNSDLNQKAVVYTENFGMYMSLNPTAEEIANGIANVAAHEAGHLLGLHHESELDTIMAYVGIRELFINNEFERAPLMPNVFPIGHQDSPKTLMQNLGPRP